ncbi:unnamed protein product, partial [Dicrocoelium dendriticum]
KNTSSVSSRSGDLVWSPGYCKPPFPSPILRNFVQENKCNLKRLTGSKVCTGVNSLDNSQRAMRRRMQQLEHNSRCTAVARAKRELWDSLLRAKEKLSQRKRKAYLQHKDSELKDKQLRDSLTEQLREVSLEVDLVFACAYHPSAINLPLYSV